MINAFELVIGFPIHLQLQNQGLASLWVYVLAGVLILIVPVAMAWFVVGGRMGVPLSVGTMGPLGMIWSTFSG